MTDLNKPRKEPKVKKFNKLGGEIPRVDLMHMRQVGATVDITIAGETKPVQSETIIELICECRFRVGGIGWLNIEPFINLIESRAKHFRLVSVSGRSNETISVTVRTDKRKKAMVELRALTAHARVHLPQYR